MTVESNKLPVDPLSALALALASLAAWSFEVRVIKGWPGLRWLSGYPMSAIAICLFVALAMRMVLVRRQHSRASWRMVLVSTLLSLAAFELARRTLLESQQITVGLFEVWLTLVVLPLVASLLLAAVGHYLVIRIFWGWISRWTPLILALAIILVFPLSLLTIHLIPSPDGESGFIHAVKVGYPIFWITLTMSGGVALALRIKPRSG